MAEQSHFEFCASNPVPNVILSVTPVRIPIFVLLLAIPVWAQSARDIVARSLKADQETVAVAAQYTYREQAVVKELDSSDRATKTTTETHDVLFLGGKRYEHLIEKDGKPLPPREARKEQEKFDKATAEASRVSPEERQRRFAEYTRQRERQRDSVQGIPDAYNFTMLGRPVIDGRPCYLIQAEPRPGYRGKNSNLLRRMRGKLWIDQQDYEWVRVEAAVLDDINFGLFLAKLSKGAEFRLERIRVNNEVWLPKKLTVKLSARALVKNFHFEQVTTYSDYRKYSADARIVDSVESKP